MLTSEQIRAARAMLRMEQRQLAEAAGVSLETIKRIARRRPDFGSLGNTRKAPARARGGRRCLGGRERRRARSPNA